MWRHPGTVPGLCSSAKRPKATAVGEGHVSLQLSGPQGVLTSNCTAGPICRLHARFPNTARFDTVGMVTLLTPGPVELALTLLVAGRGFGPPFGALLIRIARTVKIAASNG